MGAILFIDVLNHSPVNLDDVQIILLEINGYAANDALFIDAVKKRQPNEENSKAVKNMTILDLAPVLTAEKYYDLDDHMRPAGHKAVMEQLLPLIH